MTRHTMFEDVSREELETAIDCWVRGRNAERNRAIVRDRLIFGVTFEELAERYELSVRQVKNIVYRQESVVCGKLRM